MRRDTIARIERATGAALDRTRHIPYVRVMTAMAHSAVTGRGQSLDESAMTPGEFRALAPWLMAVVLLSWAEEKLTGKLAPERDPECEFGNLECGPLHCRLRTAAHLVGKAIDRAKLGPVAYVHES